MKLTVVIVSYNVKHYLLQCLYSLERALQDIDAEVYVVDNDSRDDTVVSVEKQFPQVHVVASNHNLGFARANNIAIRQSEGEYVLLLNPDTIVEETTIRACLSFMDAHPRAGACGVKMLKVDGDKALESRRGLPTPLTAFYKMSGLCKRFPTSRRFGKYYMGYLPWDSAQQIEVISGAFCFLRRKAIDEVGLLDEDFFMYGEDIDLSYRILKGDWTCWYLPARILHYKGESTQKSSFRYVHVFYQAMLIFFRKHYSHLSILLSLPIKSAIYAKAFVTLVEMQYYRARKALGFTDRSALREQEYIVFGSDATIVQCRQMARQKGISMRLEKASPQGHLALLDSLDKNRLYHMVYDTSAFSYEQVFGLFASHSLPNVDMAFYYPQSKVVITPQEILR